MGATGGSAPGIRAVSGGGGGDGGGGGGAGHVKIKISRVFIDSTRPLGRSQFNSKHSAINSSRDVDTIYAKVF